MGLVDIKLTDAQMTYIQFVIQVGNVRLLEQILATEEGQSDFVTSRDVHGNSPLHYIALFDQENVIEVVLNQIIQSPELASKLKILSEKQNRAGQSPMDFFFVGKRDSYELLHNFLAGQNRDSSMPIPSLTNILQIKKQLQRTQTLQKKSSFARLPSARTQASSGSQSSSNKDRMCRE